MASMNRQFGAAYRQVASYGFSPEFKKFMETHPVELQRGTTVARAIQEKKPVQIPDVLADKDFDYKEGAKTGGVRTVAAVPMLKGDDLIGVIAIYRREVRPFTDKQIRPPLRHHRNGLYVFHELWRKPVGLRREKTRPLFAA